MKAIFPALLLFLTPGLVHAGDALQDARKNLLRGYYGEAREQYQELLKGPKTKGAAVLGLSKTFQSEGKYDEAQKSVEEALKVMDKDPALQARLAELLYLRGKWDEAEKAAQKGIALKKDNFLARWVRGQILRDKGQWDKADEEFRWFVRTYTERNKAGMDITDSEELLLVGVAGLERARLHHLTDQFQFILEEVLDFSVKQDKIFWPAEYQAGRLYLEKFNKAAAARALDRALKINPSAADVLTAKGLAAMQRLETKEAELYAEQALKINPSLTEALRLKADLRLFAGEYEEALKDLEKARAVNPREETTLALFAAAHFLRRDDKALETIIKQVEEQSAAPAIFWFELADNLDRRRFFGDAEKYFKKAMELEPRLPGPLAGLGLLHMRLGNEEEARKLLDQALDADEYNLRVSNTLRVLKHLDDYDTLKTEHFLLRYEKKNDEVLALVMAKYLEEIYQELAEKFDYRPKGPILIEVFNRHDMFSGRVVQLPDLHTIGASTGKIIAMVSPRDTAKVIARPFNWVRVIRHELVHVFNLEQTNFRIPHWYTEGLAVKLEGSKPPPAWNNLVAEKLREKDLLNLDNILLGFIRPRNPEQWNQAYMQSLLYVEYIEKEYGAKSIGQLLAAYAEGLETDEALKKVFKVSKAEFEKGYVGFLEGRVPKDAIKAQPGFASFRAVKEAYEKDTENPDLAALLAERYYHLGNRKEAKVLADKAMELKKFHPLGVYVKALVMTDEGSADTAFGLLSKTIDEKSDNLKPLRLLAKLQFDRKKFAEAAKLYERCRELDPFDSSWLTLLTRAYTQAGDDTKLLATLKELADATPDDLGTRKQIAKMSQKEGKHADVETYARQALEIDVLDADARTMFLAALTAQGKNDEAKAWGKLLEP